MFIIAILVMVQIYVIRHPDLIASANLIFVSFTLIVGLCVIGVVSSKSIKYSIRNRQYIHLTKCNLIYSALN